MKSRMGILWDFCGTFVGQIKLEPVFVNFCGTFPILPLREWEFFGILMANLINERFGQQEKQASQNIIVDYIRISDDGDRYSANIIISVS